MARVPSGHPEMGEQARRLPATRLMPQVNVEITEAFDRADRDPMTLVPSGHPALADQVRRQRSKAQSSPGRLRKRSQKRSTRCSSTSASDRQSTTRCARHDSATLTIYTGAGYGLEQGRRPSRAGRPGRARDRRRPGQGRSRGVITRTSCWTVYPSEAPAAGPVRQREHQLRHQSDRSLVRRTLALLALTPGRAAEA